MPSVTASDFSNGEETEDHAPTIPELISSLRDSFQTADFDRAEEALIAREADLRRRIQREADEFHRLGVLSLTEELTAVKKVKKEEEVPDEGKEVIWELKENRRLKSEVESRMVSLEDDVLRWCGERLGGLSVREDHKRSGSVVNMDTVFDALIASHANGTLQIPAREGKLDRVIQKQREEFAAREKTHMFEMQKMQRIEKEYAALQKKHQCQLKEKDSVESELKGCREEIERLKWELNVMEERHRIESDEIKQKEQSSRLEALEVEYAALQKKHQSQLEEQVKVENELKDCRLEIERLKGDLNMMKKKHKNEFEEIEQKHQSKLLEMLKVENEIKWWKEEGKVLEEKYKNKYKALEQKNESYYQSRLKAEIELKVCKSELDELKEERKVLNQKHQCHLLEVENELKHCKVELVTLKEELNISNEKNEKLLEEVSKHGKDKRGVVNFSSPNDKEVKNQPMYVEFEDGITRLDKFMKAKYLGSKNMDKRSKNNGMTDSGRIKKCISDLKHIINVEDLYDYVPANSSPRGDGVGNSGAPKSSYEGVILLSDSEDDCAPGEPDFLGLKRKRASPNASDNNNVGHNFEHESSPASANKKHQMLHPCGSLVSNNGKQNNPSSCDQEILIPSGDEVKEEVASPGVKNCDSESSSSTMFSSDGSEDNGDINF